MYQCQQTEYSVSNSIAKLHIYSGLYFETTYLVYMHLCATKLSIWNSITKLEDLEDRILGGCRCLNLLKENIKFGSFVVS